MPGENGFSPEDARKPWQGYEQGRDRVSLEASLEHKLTMEGHGDREKDGPEPGGQEGRDAF